MNYCPKCGLPIGFPMNYTGMLCSCEETITTNSTTMSQQYYIFTPDGKEVRVIEGKDVPKVPLFLSMIEDSQSIEERLLQKALATKSVKVGNGIHEVTRWMLPNGDIPDTMPVAEVFRLWMTNVPYELPDRFQVQYTGSCAQCFPPCECPYVATILPVSQPVVTKGEVSEEELAKVVSEAQYKWMFESDERTEGAFVAQHLKSKYTITPKE